MPCVYSFNLGNGKSDIGLLVSLINNKPLKPGSYRGRKNTSPEKILLRNGEKHA